MLGEQRLQIVQMEAEVEAVRFEDLDSLTRQAERMNAAMYLVLTVLGVDDDDAPALASQPCLIFSRRYASGEGLGEQALSLALPAMEDRDHPGHYEVFDHPRWRVRFLGDQVRHVEAPEPNRCGRPYGARAISSKLRGDRGHVERSEHCALAAASETADSETATRELDTRALAAARAIYERAVAVSVGEAPGTHAGVPAVRVRPRAPGEAGSVFHRG